MRADKLIKKLAPTVLVEVRNLKPEKEEQARVIFEQVLRFTIDELNTMHQYKVANVECEGIGTIRIDAKKKKSCFPKED